MMDPQKFFISLLDFFSIILPGAIASFLLMGLAPEIIGEETYSGLSPEALWLMFTVSSYLLGHFIYLIGAFLLDEIIYDRLRKYPLTRQIRSLAKGNRLSPKWLRSLVGIIVSSESDKPLHAALRIKNRRLEKLNASGAINAFQWCKARLSVENKAAFDVVQRFEADSKFFRSLVVVSSIGFVAFAIQENLLTASLCFVLTLLSFWRYCSQRHKTTRQAYWYIITMESEKDVPSTGNSSSASDIPTHAGGVVFRRSGAKVEFLLVGALKDPSDFVLPKGYVELEETWQETAVREVQEESGVWARVCKGLGRKSFSKGGQAITTEYYLMEMVESGKSKEGRSINWLEIDKAMNAVRYPELKEIFTKVREEHLGDIIGNKI